MNPDLSAVRTLFRNRLSALSCMTSVSIAAGSTTPLHAGNNCFVRESAGEWQFQEESESRLLLRGTIRYTFYARTGDPLQKACTCAESFSPGNGSIVSGTLGVRPEAVQISDVEREHAFLKCTLSVTFTAFRL